MWWTYTCRRSLSLPAFHVCCLRLARRLIILVRTLVKSLNRVCIFLNSRSLPMRGIFCLNANLERRISVGVNACFWHLQLLQLLHDDDVQHFRKKWSDECLMLSIGVKQISSQETRPMWPIPESPQVGIACFWHLQLLQLLHDDDVQHFRKKWSDECLYKLLQLFSQNLQWPFPESNMHWEHPARAILVLFLPGQVPEYKSYIVFRCSYSLKSQSWHAGLWACEPMNFGACSSKADECCVWRGQQQSTPKGVPQ